MKKTYKEIIQTSPKGDEETMWKSIENVDALLLELEESMPDLVRQFLAKEYVLLNGPHLNEDMATEIVSNMHHKATDGSIISGELINIDEVMPYLNGMENVDIIKWDAYAGINAFLHDMAKTTISREGIINAAIEFWLKDDDFKKEKVFWYFTSRE